MSYKHKILLDGMSYACLVSHQSVDLPYLSEGKDAFLFVKQMWKDYDTLGRTALEYSYAACCAQRAYRPQFVLAVYELIMKHFMSPTFQKKIKPRISLQELHFLNEWLYNVYDLVLWGTKEP